MQNLRKYLFVYIVATVLLLSIFIAFSRSNKYKSMLNRKKRYIATSELAGLSYGLIKESDINVDYIISILDNKKVLNAQLLKDEKHLYKRTFSTVQTFLDAELEEGIYYILEGSILVKIKEKKPSGADLSNGDCVAKSNIDQWIELNRE
jgi:hypothetical protein